ncbi:unnamed protein product, partial [Owenia fusiformis]
ICDIAAAFADLCRENGVDAPLWRDVFNCQMKCGDNEEYLANGPGCERKCLEGDQRYCNTPKREGCFCKIGYIRCNGTCSIGKDYCPPSSDPRYRATETCCMHSSWHWALIDGSYFTQDIRGGELVKHLCPKGQVFKVTSHNECKCIKGCKWSNWATWSEICPFCPKSCDGGYVTCTRIRTRQGPYCTPISPISESETSTKICPKTCCWSNWASWSENCPSCPDCPDCSSCGGGSVICTHTRTRQGPNCATNVQLDTKVSTKTCLSPPCCIWSPWASWSVNCPFCPKSCSGGSVSCTRARTRQGPYCTPTSQSQ